jgi:hypothetical protein
MIGVLAVFFVATVIRSAFGFGEALIAVPLLALMLPVEVAAPVAVMVSVTVALIVVAQDWREIHVRSAGWLLVSTLFGIPVGLWILKNVPEGAAKGALGVVILAFGWYLLANRWRGELKNDRPAWFFGFLAGVLGGSYGVNGPPLVIYGVLRGWTPANFRATLQGYFLPASLAGTIGYWMAGLWTAEVSRLYLWSLPAVVPAIFVGRWLNRRLEARRFLMWVHWGLVGIGMALIWEGWRKGV